MNTTTHLQDSFQEAFMHPTRGVVGLVDDLLRLCPEEGVRIEWQDDQCWVRSTTNGSEEVFTCPVPNSVFRAVLARVAALCNDRTANSVSPYGGRGELLVGANPSVVFRATFANTPENRALELVPTPARMTFKPSYTGPIESNGSKPE